MRKNEEEIKLVKIIENHQEKITDLVAREISFSIILNRTKIVTLNCSPGNYKALGLGYLFTMGILDKKEQIKTVEVDAESGQMRIDTERGQVPKNGILKKKILEFYYPENRNKKFEAIDFSLKIEANQIYHLVSEIENRAELFRHTGGAHSCALADKDGNILLFTEDISRYSTIDRIVGEAFLKSIITKDKIIITSCRITSGILKKIIAVKIPVIVSRAAPTDLSIQLAQKIGISLIGFARGSTMNVYTYPERVMI